MGQGCVKGIPVPSHPNSPTAGKVKSSPPALLQLLAAVIFNQHSLQKVGREKKKRKKKQMKRSNLFILQIRNKLYKIYKPMGENSNKYCCRSRARTVNGNRSEQAQLPFLILLIGGKITPKLLPQKVMEVPQEETSSWELLRAVASTPAALVAAAAIGDSHLQATAPCPAWVCVLTVTSILGFVSCPWLHITLHEGIGATDVQPLFLIISTITNSRRTQRTASPTHPNLDRVRTRHHSPSCCSQAAKHCCKQWFPSEIWALLSAGFVVMQQPSPSPSIHGCSTFLRSCLAHLFPLLGFLPVNHCHLVEGKQTRLPRTVNIYG